LAASQPAKTKKNRENRQHQRNLGKMESFIASEIELRRAQFSRELGELYNPKIRAENN